MAKKTAQSSPTGLLLPRPTGFARMARGSRWAVLAALIVLVLAGGWLLLWGQVKDHVLSDSRYRLDPREIEITPSPPWIHADIKAEVIRDASLDASLKILDKDLAVRIYHAFALHPWVAKVNRVSKHPPARVEVDLSYRQPVAMVEVSGGLLPVDVDGTLLPSDDFSKADAQSYPRMTGITTSPVGSAGTAWGDGRVKGGAQIAAELASQWQPLELAQITPSLNRLGVRSSADTIYELHTRGGRRIIWGHAPAAEVSGEMRAAAKISELARRLTAAELTADIDLCQGLSIEGKRRIKSLPAPP